MKRQIDLEAQNVLLFHSQVVFNICKMLARLHKTGGKGVCSFFCIGKGILLETKFKLMSENDEAERQTYWYFLDASLKDISSKLTQLNTLNNCEIYKYALKQKF